MNRTCILKSTGKVIEFQSGKAKLGTLVKNAVASGRYKEGEVEERLTKKNWATIQAEQETPAEKEAKEKEQMISREMQIITRDQAIVALKTKGKLPPDFVDDKRPKHIIEG